MAAKKKQLWEVFAEKRKMGRPVSFESPEDMWNKCEAYFKWVEDTPLLEEQWKTSAGIAHKVKVNRMRAMTLGAMQLHIGITHETWQQYRKKEEFSAICAHVDAIIYSQKFEGASADLLNHAIIARDLGLIDKKQVEINDVTEIPEDRLESEIAKYLGKA